MNQINEDVSIEKELGNPYYTVASLAAMQLKLTLDYLLGKDVYTNGFYVLDLKSFMIDKIDVN
jgi:hypothetical protein